MLISTAAAAAAAASTSTTTSCSFFSHSLSQRCIAVIGTTGVGKSDFAIQLAKFCQGEILNSDALQMYHGLNILTNKPTQQQQQGIPHHLLGTQPMNQPTYTVVDFERDASLMIDQLHSSNKLPIVVGGTHYYLQYLLFGNTDPLPSAPSSNTNTNNHTPPPIPTLASSSTASDLYTTLYQLSPSIASQWHPNDTRRLQRALNRIHSTSPLSSSTSTTTTTTSSSSLSSITTLSHTSWRSSTSWLVFWVYHPLALLDPILDQRVDQMVSAGLLDELAAVHEQAQVLVDKERGIYQAIGCKEWEPYFEAKKKMQSRNQEEKKEVDTLVGEAALASLYQRCLDSMKLATKQYARKQLLWIRNRLWPLCQRHADRVHMYVVDATQVHSPSIKDLVKTFLSNPALVPCPSKLGSPFILDQVEHMCRKDNAGQRNRQWYTCDLCQRRFLGDHEWQVHQTSKKHRRHVKFANLKKQKHMELLVCLEAQVEKKQSASW